MVKTRLILSSNVLLYVKHNEDLEEGEDTYNSDC